MDRDLEIAKLLTAQHLRKENEKLQKYKVMKKTLFTYIVSYDIMNDDEDKVRGAFRGALIDELKAVKLSESTYAFFSTQGVPEIKTKIIKLYLRAYKDNDKEENKEDKVWLICAEKKADPRTEHPFEMACYELVDELLHP